MDKGENVFEGFDLTNLGEFSNFMEGREEPSSLDTDNNDDTQQQQGVESFNEFDFTGIQDTSEPDGDDDGNTADPSSTDTDNSKKDSFLTPYAKLLMDEGVLQDFDIEKFDGTADGLVDAFRQQVVKHVEEYKQTLDPRVKWLQDNVEQGVPLESLLAIDKQRLELSKITPEILAENKDLQKDLVRNYLRATTNGWTDAKIEREVSRLDDLQELETESKESFELLKQINQQQEQILAEQAKVEREKAVKQQQETLDTFKRSLNETKEIIPGMQFTPVMKDKIFKTLTTPVAFDQAGNPLNSIAKARAENPLDFEMKLAYLFEVTKGFSDWTSLLTPGKKNAIKEFEQAARRMDYSKDTGVQVPEYEKASQKEIIKAMSMFTR
jgi:hypothetical protein